MQEVHRTESGCGISFEYRKVHYLEDRLMVQAGKDHGQ